MTARTTRLLIGAAVAAALLGGCGGSPHGSVDTAGESADSLVVPDVDVSTEAQADAVHTQALEALMAAPFRYETSAETGMGDISVTGEVDPAAEQAHLTMRLPLLDDADQDLRALVENGLESIFIHDRMYAHIPIGPAKECWFDYGVDSPLMAGPGWMPAAMSAMDGHARGFVRDDHDTVVIDADAVNLVGAVVGKLARAMYIDDLVPVAAVVKLKDGYPTSVEFDLATAIKALLDAGAEPPRGVSAGQLRAAFGGVVTISFVSVDSVDLVAPDADRVIDASGLDENVDPYQHVEPCPAAA